MTTDFQEHVNGRLQKGRAVPDLARHTFRDSQVTVKLHKLSPMVSSDIIAQCRRELADSEPQPPMVDVDFGQGTVKRPHKDDPTYIAMKAEWETKVNALANERLFKLAALYAVEIELGPEQYAAIERAKRLMRLTAHIDWADDPDLTPDENAQYYYIRHIACASPDDLQEFYMAVATRSQPTEAAIERHKETFPGDVPGQVDLDV